MEDVIAMSSDLTDKNGVTINAGASVMYKGSSYIVMNVNKDEVGWIGHPCANNSNTDSINLDEVHDEVEVITN